MSPTAGSAIAESLDLTVTDVTELSWEDLAAEMYDGPAYTSPCQSGCGTCACAICNSACCAVCVLHPEEPDTAG